MPVWDITITKEVEVEIEHEVEFEVWCNTCGTGLCSESEAVVTRNRGELAVRVNACPDCLEKARAEGYEDGFAEAKKEYDGSGYDAGYEAGYEAGYGAGERGA